MRLWLAIKAFFKALKEPEKAIQFVEEPVSKVDKSDPSHLRLLSILQESGRMIDFLKEDITSYSDAQVGAAVRKIHHDCGKSLEEFVAIRPIMDEAEGSVITISAGYNPSEIKIVGKVDDTFPLNGHIIHRGWKACKRSLPKKSGVQAGELLSPAEIEVR